MVEVVEAVEAVLMVLVVVVAVLLVEAVADPLACVALEVAVEESAVRLKAWGAVVLHPAAVAVALSAGLSPAWLVAATTLKRKHLRAFRHLQLVLSTSVQLLANCSCPQPATAVPRAVSLEQQGEVEAGSWEVVVGVTETRRMANRGAPGTSTSGLHPILA